MLRRLFSITLLLFGAALFLVIGTTQVMARQLSNVLIYVDQSNYYGRAHANIIYDPFTQISIATRLDAPDPMFASMIRFTGDGQRLRYIHREGYDQMRGQLIDYHITTDEVEIVLDNMRPVTFAGCAQCVNFYNAPAPYSSEIAYLAMDGIRIRSADATSNEDTRLLMPYDDESGLVEARLLWSEDGQRLVYYERAQPAQVTLIDAVTGDQQTVQLLSTIGDLYANSVLRLEGDDLHYYRFRRNDNGVGGQGRYLIQNIETGFRREVDPSERTNRIMEGTRYGAFVESSEGIANSTWVFENQRTGERYPYVYENQNMNVHLIGDYAILEINLFEPRGGNSFNIIGRRIERLHIPSGQTTLIMEDDRSTFAVWVRGN